MEVSNDIAAQEDNDFAKEAPAEELKRLENEAATRMLSAYNNDPFEEFLA